MIKKDIKTILMGLTGDSSSEAQKLAHQDIEEIFNYYEIFPLFFHLKFDDQEKKAIIVPLDNIGRYALKGIMND